MRKIILVTRNGMFVKRRIEANKIDSKCYRGHTVNGIPKYRWNFSMWFNTIMNDNSHDEKK